MAYCVCVSVFVFMYVQATSNNMRKLHLPLGQRETEMRGREGGRKGGNIKWTKKIKKITYNEMATQHSETNQTHNMAKTD